jgi:hypothetical protein
MSDTLSPEMTAFYQLYDRRMRRLMGAALCASLLLAAIIATRLPDAGAAGTRLAGTLWWFGVLITPAFTAAWWLFTELMAQGRRKASPPDWRLPMTADDARNARRISHAGFVFTLALAATGIANQSLVAALALGHPLGYPAGQWIARAIMVIVGAVTMYLGNVWPRMPILRAPEQKPAAQMKVHRLIGWSLVIFGLMIVLLGFFLPLLQAPRP